MATESLQLNSLGTVRDVTVSGSGIQSAFANLGLNIAGALASVGVTKLAQASGLSTSQIQRTSSTLFSSGATLPPQVNAVLPQKNWLAFGVVAAALFGVGLLVVLARR